MSDLIASSLAVAFGPRPLFSDVSLTVDAGDRIALVGPNGAGKTTLLRVLAGKLAPSVGEVRVPEHLVVALHDQRPERSPQALRALVAPPRMVALEAELRALELAMADGDPEKLRRWEQVRAAYDALGGEGWHTRVDAVLRGLGFVERQLDQRLDTLSGGELTRASLARTLAASPDVLLLDEPTNHLDLETISWLQEHVASLPGGVVLVSHDRWFIEETCTSVVEISAGRARRFRGSFVEYRTQQALEAATHHKHVERWQDEVARLQRFVDRFSAGTRSKQAQSRVKALDRLREDVPQYADLRTRRGLGFSLPKVDQPGRSVFELRGVELGFGDPADPSSRTLLEPSDLVIERGEKVFLLGANGAGKSTLLHVLAAATIPLLKEPEGSRGGEVRVGYGVRARLLSQHDSELVDTGSMLGNMQLASPGIGRTQAMNLLGLFGFSGDDAERLVGSLSGGERRRLLMSMALTGSDNVLLLDEPTNHLDIESREALEAALAEYAGTLICISHDRAMVEGVATRTVVLHDERLRTVMGGFTEARAVLAGEAPAAPTPPPTPAAGNGRAKKPARKPASTGGTTVMVSAPGADDASGRTVRRRKGARAAGGKVRRPGTIETELERLEGELGAVQQRMLDPEVYGSPQASADCLQDHSRLERDIARRYEELDAALEHFGNS